MIDSITIATVVKKALEVLASNKEGRNFLGYVIGIAIFILLLPAIVLTSMFAWMSGNDDSSLISGNLTDNFQNEYIYVMDQLDIVAENITAVFHQHNLTGTDIEKAKMIYLSFLVGEENEPNFYTNLVYCFLNANNERSVYDLVTQVFSVTISHDDQKELDELYDITTQKLTHIIE